MKTNIFTSIRWKLIFFFIFSFVLACLGTLLLLGFALLLVRLRVAFVERILMDISRTVTPIPMIIATIALLFVFCFFILSHRWVRYIAEISKSLEQIAQGNFDIKVPIRYYDEIGELAENINLMTAQLKKSIDEERNAERSKNELITSVSHDLRTPLTSILGYLGLAAQDKYRDEIELRHYVEIAYHKSQRLKRLIDELFEFTRVNYGGQRFDTASINLGELLEQLCEEFVPVLREVGMSHRLQLPQERILVEANGDMMVRVFENLISNAVRYSQEGKQVDILLVREADEAVVHVVNYGQVIEKEHLPHLFDKFYRVEGSRSRQTGGSGLGLAIVKSIVDLHGGTISVESNTGSTTFTVCLKINK